MVTMTRSIRIPDELWRAAIEKTGEEGTTVTSVVIDALRAYLTDGRK